MKYRVLGLIMVIVVILTSLIASRDNNDLLKRTHHHLLDKAIITNPNNEKGFYTHLPIICLEMRDKEPQVHRVTYENGRSDTVSEVITGTVIVIDNKDQFNHLTDNPSLKVLSNIQVRGNSSKRHDKKNFKLSFIYEDGTENKTEGLMEMEPHDEWALHGPYLDRTLIRNYMCMNIAGQILPYTPDVRFCELFVNGDYRGVYVAMETVARGEGRVDIRAYDEGKPISSYIIKGDWYSACPNNFDPFTSYTKMLDYSTQMSIVYPGESLTPEIKEYITQEISSYEKALYSYDYDEKNGYRSFFDVNSFVDYAIINEFFQNYDAGSLSTYFYKDLGDKLHIGPVWDFNSAFNNFPEQVQGDFGVLRTVRFNMLIKDREFVDKLINRYRVLRQSILSEAYLIRYIDDTVAFLGPAIQRNFEVWDNSFNYQKMQDEIRLDPKQRNPLSYEEAVAGLKEYIRTRGSWLDEHIDTLRQYCHESATKKFNH